MNSNNDYGKKMVQSFLYMELPFDYISLDFESYFDKTEEVTYSNSGGNDIILEISKIIDPNFKDYFQTSFQKLIPETSILELFAIKSPNLALFFLLFKIEIKLSESEYFINDLIDKMLKWFPIFIDFYPEVPRLERIVTNIPITKAITESMELHFMSLNTKKKIRPFRMADYNFKSFISEYPRLSNSNILLKLYKKLHAYYQNLFWNYPISTRTFNFYGKITKRDSSDFITIFKELLNEFHSYLISLYSYIGEDMEDFLREMESFRYKMSSLEFEKLIEYEKFFEEIYNNFFRNEIPEWCRGRFEKWVFEHYKDKDFSINQPVMILNLPDFPKTYLNLRVRIQEVLTNIKHLLLSKSKNLKDDKTKMDLIEVKSLREPSFINAFKSALENKEYLYLDPMNKSGAWAEIHYVYSREDKEERVAKVYKEPIGRINEKIYKSDAKRLMKIDHENVVKIIDKGIIEYEAKEYFFLILEHIRGKNFDEIDSRLFFEKPYSERLNYFVQALDGINEFRANFDLHRDLHPGNIILSDEDKNRVRTIKIIDPGSSRYYYEPEDEDIDLYSIKEGLINLFLRPEEINKINESFVLKELNFPELREQIKQLNNEEKRKIDLENNSILNLYNELFQFLEEIFTKEQVNIDYIRSILHFIDVNEKDFQNYISFHRNQTTPTSVQNFFFLNGKYRIHFIYNKRPRIKITEGDTSEWIDSSIDSEKSKELLELLKKDVMTHIQNNYYINNN